MRDVLHGDIVDNLYSSFVPSHESAICANPLHMSTAYDLKNLLNHQNESTVKKLNNVKESTVCMKSL